MAGLAPVRARLVAVLTRPELELHYTAMLWQDKRRCVNCIARPPVRDDHAESDPRTPCRAQAEGAAAAEETNAEKSARLAAAWANAPGEVCGRVYVWGGGGGLRGGGRCQVQVALRSPLAPRSPP